MILTKAVESWQLPEHKCGANDRSIVDQYCRFIIVLRLSRTKAGWMFKLTRFDEKYNFVCKSCKIKFQRMFLTDHRHKRDKISERLQHFTTYVDCAVQLQETKLNCVYKEICPQQHRYGGWQDGCSSCCTTPIYYYTCISPFKAIFL